MHAQFIFIPINFILTVICVDVYGLLKSKRHWCSYLYYIDSYYAGTYIAAYLYPSSMDECIVLSNKSVKKNLGGYLYTELLICSYTWPVLKGSACDQLVLKSVKDFKSDCDIAIYV